MSRLLRAEYVDAWGNRHSAWTWVADIDEPADVFVFEADCGFTRTATLGVSPWYMQRKGGSDE